MKLIVQNLSIPLEKDSDDFNRVQLANKLSLNSEEFVIIKILSKELILKDTSRFFYKMSYAVEVADTYENSFGFNTHVEPVHYFTPASLNSKPIITGFGPAGMFAALRLVDYGLKPLIFERGKRVEERIADVNTFIKTAVLNTESNIQFGEGGAGTFSDGKLFSRRDNNTSYVNEVLKKFVQFGAPKEIEYVSKPHLGTDVLRKIVINIREYLLSRGCEIFYSSKVTDFILNSDNEIAGAIVNNQREYLSKHLFLATGNSARDTFKLLHKKGVNIQAKPITVGVRIEHPADVINIMRYGKKYFGHKKLPAAAYSLNYTDRTLQRGVYTFCMCPGGEIINASSSEGHLTVNGMSYSSRAGQFSNGAIVATVKLDDYKNNHPLAGILFQEKIEKKGFIAGGKTFKAPAENLFNFLDKTNNNEPGPSSYKMGLIQTELKELLPTFIINQLKNAFHKWELSYPLFIDERAILVGFETRTSSLVKILRTEKFESSNIIGLYPIGEGSGYTGGITSAAADGLKAVDAAIIKKK
ncbi:MAG: dehydrogenase [Deltaproteobacteria bacterium]|nr:dehydrogenase [Deltaproteobacteria bacterium]